jgi:hypothetical protein
MEVEGRFSSFIQNGFGLRMPGKGGQNYGASRRQYQ